MCVASSLIVALLAPALTMSVAVNFRISVAVTLNLPYLVGKSWERALKSSEMWVTW